MNKIKRISEAFSLQPNEKHISTSWELTQRIPHIMSIQEEFSSNGECRVYTGYGYDNQILFTWIAQACNVEYFDTEFSCGIN